MNKRKLQRLIDNCAKKQSAAFKANVALNEYCVEIYGFEPGDRDVDDILDAVMGASGDTNGMTAEDFDAAMKATDE